MSADRPPEPEPTSLAEQVTALPWFHQIDFGNGLLSPGRIGADKIPVWLG